MNSKICITYLFIIFAYNIMDLYAQTSICSYESDVSYLISTDITYVYINDYSRAPALCCSLCSFQPGCIGRHKKNFEY